VTTRPSDAGIVPGRDRWLSMRRACQILGVNQSTLRQWSNDGRVPVFLTPGGHRRYREDDLRSLADCQRSGSDESGLAAALLAVHERYGGVTRRAQQGSDWLQSVDQDDRRQFRVLGTSMLQLLSSYVVTTSRRERELALSRGREVAAQYGEISARHGLSLSRATEAFLLFRTPILETVSRWLAAQPATANASEILRRVTQFMDQVLVAMAAAHEEWTAGHAGYGARA
jgi:hypothetical protein